MADYGRRLAGKLTADLVLESPQGLNPVGDYELDLRRNKLAVIENLGATRDQFESIDLSENEIMRLDGFPKLQRLEQLLLSRNRIYRIERRIGGEQWQTMNGRGRTDGESEMLTTAGSLDCAITKNRYPILRDSS